jgi:nucleotide-binding universal stress UspA family protein
MYHSALVALNTEGGNEAATQMAVDLAVRQHLQLSAIAVIDPSAVAPAKAVPLGATAYKERRDDALKTQAHERAQQELDAFAQRCGAAGVTCELALREGHLDEEIAFAVQAVDLLVIGHGNGVEGSDERDHVSRLDDLLRSSARPSLVVPGPTAEVRRVVVAYDGSLQSARALHDFALSGFWQDCPVDVLSLAADSAPAAETAERGAAYLKTHGYAAEARPMIAKYQEAKHILEFVQESGAGILVMGAHGKSHWRTFVVGTVTRSLLQSTPVPVFVSH